jgi:hypothetical protein
MNTPNSSPSFAPVPEPTERPNFHNHLGIEEPPVGAAYAPQGVTQALERHVGHALPRGDGSSKLAEAYAARAAGDEDAFRHTVDAHRHIADRTTEQAADKVFGRFGAAVSGPNARTVQFGPIAPQRQVAERAVNPSTVYLPLNGQLRTDTTATVPQHPPVQNPTIDRARQATTRAATSGAAAPEHRQTTPEEWAFAKARAEFANTEEGTQRNLAKLALREANANLLAARRRGAIQPAPAAKPAEEKFDWFGNAF